MNFVSNRVKEKTAAILKTAGITVNGSEPSDIIIHDDRLYNRVIRDGSLGLGEGYMDGWWEASSLDQFFTKVFVARLDRSFDPIRFKALLGATSLLMNRQSIKRSREVGKRHYDVGNDLYRAMLDSRLTYTCGYWKEAHNLEEAQTAKLDLVCRKLDLKPGQKILDIGCGWGSFVKFAAQNYGVEAVGITISEEQAKLARESCAGLPVEIRLEDYRDTRGTFDHIISIGMFEHVGDKNYRTYMEAAHRLLKDGGLFLLHTIGGNTSVHGTDPWIDKYIFPSGMMPSIKQIGDAIEDIFVMEDWHNFGPDYDKTLMAWHQNFNDHWPELTGTYDERFRRMWNYYLLSCTAAFRSRTDQLWQIVLSKGDRLTTYQTSR